MSNDEDSSEGSGKKRGPSAATVLMGIARAGVRIFRSSGGQVYARCAVGEHFECYAVGEKGGGLRDWLIRMFQEYTEKLPPAEAVTQVHASLRAEGRFTRDVDEVFVRIGFYAGCIYLDLGGTDYRTVEITPLGWSVIGEPPVNFLRPAGMLPLVEPRRGGSLEQLRDFINVADDADWMLMVGCLLGWLMPTGAYPHLAIYGERGSAKTSATRLLRSVIDPNSALERKPPKDEDELGIAARHSAVLTFDNASSMPDWLSDALCRLSTGAAAGKRTLYTDDEETLFSARRPVVFNGINDVVSRGDLLSRLVAVTLQPVTKRLTETALALQFAEAQPCILGALLDAAVTALARRGQYGEDTFAEVPRLVDFALWCEAASPALGWQHGEFINTLMAAQSGAVTTQLENNVLAKHIVEWVATLQPKADGELWSGAATALYDALDDWAGGGQQPPTWLPKNPSWISRDIARLASELRGAYGIDIENQKRNGARKLVVYRR
jgi:hypothetical protein